MATKKENIDKYIDAMIDIIIDSYIAKKRRKRDRKCAKLDMSSNFAEGNFDGRLGQIPSDLSSPGRPLKLYGKEKSNTVSEV
jgi:hypothetical protein